MHLFYDDYSEGAHPAVLEALCADNGGQERGYGRDEHSALATRRIQAQFGRNAEVHFAVGGTQANAVCLAALLRPHEGVIAPTSAHISRHEAGAIEATGHKVITVAASDGKLSPRLIDEACSTHEDEHTVRPRAVFVSQSTELGTVYALTELTALTAHAHDRGLLVYLDGARLSVGLAAMDPAVSLADLAAAGIDMMCVGGTKNGALCGEAIVVLNPGLDLDLRYHLKQRGALLAKGRLIGSQFARLFDDDGLWYELGRCANARAREMAAGLVSLGIPLSQPPESNQLFPILPDPVIAELEKEFGVYRWEPAERGTSVIRLVCSWATTPAAVEALLEHLGRLLSRRHSGRRGATEAV